MYAHTKLPPNNLPPHQQDALHDLYAGLKPIPLLPLTATNFAYPPTLLDEFCRQEGLAPPTYSLHTTGGKDHQDREINLYLYKIQLPALFGATPLCSNRLMTSPDDAKHDAAQFVLAQLFPQLPNGDLIASNDTRDG